MFDKEDKAVSQAVPEKPKPKPKTNNRVYSRWPRPVGGQMLLESTGVYRLQPEADWPVSKTFLLDSDDFQALPEPTSFDIGGVSDEALWRAGIVNVNSPMPLSALQQALHYSEGNLTTDQLITMLRTNKE